MSVNAHELLSDILADVNPNAAPPKSLEHEDLDAINVIISRVKRGQNKAVITVLLTLLTKKVMTPQQDIRRHQANMKGGFSGRSLDERHITPFLRENNFPYMSAGSGWLTRSLEQSLPYTLDYPGRISPQSVKSAFLKVVDRVEQHGISALDCLTEIFRQLVELRSLSQNILLPKPKSKSIDEIVSLISKFWEVNSPGMDRIPVLAVYSVYECLAREITRYTQYKLLPLLPQNAADQKTGRTGDIDLCVNDRIIEATDIKFRIPLTPELVSATIEKVKRTSVRRYYLLSTNEVVTDVDVVTKLCNDAHHSYGCQVIANGVIATLKHYLRLISSTDEFSDIFVTHLENDTDISYATKMLWEQTVSDTLSESATTQESLQKRLNAAVSVIE